MSHLYRDRFIAVCVCVCFFFSDIFITIIAGHYCLPIQKLKPHTHKPNKNTENIIIIISSAMLLYNQDVILAMIILK